MKLRNKKTGEIREIKNILVDGMFNVKSLAELNEEWEDYEEPEEVWYIDYQGMVRSASKEENDWFKENEIGNCFYSKEEAEKAVEKLKAIKRLKDAGFEFFGWDCEFDHNECIRIALTCPSTISGIEAIKDLDLLFGGEDDDDEDEDMPTNAEINDLTDMGYGGE